MSSDWIIRPAVADDAAALIALDHVARADPARRAFITRSIADGHCAAAANAHFPIGYVVLEYTFFTNGFVSMLYVAEHWRRQGVGRALMGWAAETCVTPKLFASTNRSNATMIALLKGLGYQESGVIENLDECDPQLVFLKRPRAE